MDRRRAVRLATVLVLVGCLGVLAHGYLTAPTTASAGDVPNPEPRDGVTVVTESARHGTITAWHPNGSLLYYEDEHTKYFDVDPVANRSLTVEYATVDTIHTEGPTCSEPPCTRNAIERANLSTGAVETVYARYDAREHAAEWHDHVRVDQDHILVADMIADQFFLVNTTTELVEWRWDGQIDYNVTGGGPFPTDWMHLNDVEVLADGRYVASLRNQDQVVFVDPETGLQPNWTLGSDGAHDILYEQHNPDYISPARGGPALVVADSENGRVVEYQRTNGTWERTWAWSDERMQWPRDADRLHSGNTLVADTHGSRVLEIGRDGEVVWSVPVPHPYDAERLPVAPNGSASSGASAQVGGSHAGESAQRLGLESRGGEAAESGSGGGLNPLVLAGDLLEYILPSWVLNGLYYVAPIWMGGAQFAALAVAALAILGWAGAEVRWRLPALSLRSPVYRTVDDGDVDGDGSGDGDSDATGDTE